MAAVSASAVALAACGSSGAANTSSSSKVVSFSLWESHNGGPVGGAMTTLVNEFNASHPSVHVSIVVTKASSKLPAAIAAGNPPVLAEISHYDGTLVKGLALQSWNPYLKKSSVFTPGNVFPAVYGNGEVAGGQHYRLEADAKVSEVFYNESMFQAAGITSPPATWSQLAADAAKLKSASVIPLGWKDSSAHILPAFMSNGGTLLSGSNSVGTRVAFNTAAMRTTLTQFHSMYAAGDLVFDHGTTLREDLASGHMAMIDGTSAGYQKVLNAVGGKFKVGAFVEPGGTTGHAANLVQGLGFVLPKGHTAAQDQAAWTFVQWWFESAQQVKWDELTGYAPETRAAMNAIPKSFLATHPGLQASLAAISSSYTVGRPVSDSYNEVQAVLDSVFQQVVTGAQGVSAGMAQLQKQGNSYMSGASAL